MYCVEAQWLKELVGPAEVCPGTSVSGPSYTFSAKSFVNGCFSWAVYEDGQWTPSVQPGCGCTGPQPSKSSEFTYQFNNTTGSAKVRVYFLSAISILCNHDVMEVNIVKRVFGPGEPYDLDGGDLSLCPGETKTVYIPGVPGQPNSDANCYWHYKWDWTAPGGWSINGGDNVERTGAISVQLTAPSSVIPGDMSGKLEVGSEPEWPHFVKAESAIRIGYSENVSIAGSSLLCTTNTYVYNTKLTGRD